MGQFISLNILPPMTCLHCILCCVIVHIVIVNTHRTPLMRTFNILLWVQISIIAYPSGIDTLTQILTIQWRMIENNYLSNGLHVWEWQMIVCELSLTWFRYIVQHHFYENVLSVISLLLHFSDSDICIDCFVTIWSIIQWWNKLYCQKDGPAQISLNIEMTKLRDNLRF